MPSFSIPSPEVEDSASCAGRAGEGEGTWARRKPDGTEGRCCWMSLMLAIDVPRDALCGRGGERGGVLPPLLEDAMALGLHTCCGQRDIGFSLRPDQLIQGHRSFSQFLFLARCHNTSADMATDQKHTKR